MSCNENFSKNGKINHHLHLVQETKAKFFVKLNEEGLNQEFYGLFYRFFPNLQKRTIQLKKQCTITLMKNGVLIWLTSLNTRFKTKNVLNTLSLKSISSQNFHGVSH